MIEFVYAWLQDLWENLADNFHPFWDTLDILLVACAVYWLLILIPMTLPIMFVIEYAAWLWWYGHNFNEMVPSPSSRSCLPCSGRARWLSSRPTPTPTTVLG